MTLIVAEHRGEQWPLSNQCPLKIALAVAETKADKIRCSSLYTKYDEHTSLSTSTAPVRGATIDMGD